MQMVKVFVLLVLTTIAGDAFAKPKQMSICPDRPDTFVKTVQIFDGPVADMATLVPDETKEDQGFWTLDYVYKAGRTVNVRCEYADKTSVDINLAEKIQKCSYRISAKKTYTLQCQ